MQLTFGKHKGKTLEQIPRSYVAWLAQNAHSSSVQQAAHIFLKEHPLENVIPPYTYQEASRLAWMAEHNYGDARERLLGSRDSHGYLCVIDEEDDQEHAVLLQVSDIGSIHFANFYECQTLEEVQTILQNYPQVDPSNYLEDVAERLTQEADQKRRTLIFYAPKHTIELCIWGNEVIDVNIDGREQGEYFLRELTAREKNDLRWKNAVAALEPDPLCAGAHIIGLTQERYMRMKEKLQEIEGNIQ